MRPADLATRALGQMQAPSTEESCSEPDAACGGSRHRVTLPCFPCPHRSICCSYGTDLREAEAVALGQKYGQGTLWFNAEEGSWRTRVVDGRCAFKRDNCCTIHDESHFPAVCREFPWADAETGGPYGGELTICPEFVLRPELEAALRADGAAPAVAAGEAPDS